MPLELQPTQPFARDSRSAGSAERSYSLLVLRDGESSTHPLGNSGKLSIGRSAEADLRIDHVSVSREHAVLHLGESLAIEDLGSVNGTRVRDLPLQPNTRVEVFPDDVIDLGAVLLVIQYRRIEQRLRRSCERAFFELRVEEECEHARNSGVPFALAQLEVEGGLGTHAIQLLLASDLRDEDAISSGSPGKYELLWLGASLEEADFRLAALIERMARRSLRARAELRHCPRDGYDARELLGRALGRPTAPPAPQRAPQRELVVVDDTMRRVHKLLERVAGSALNVILIGEPGVGKALCAEVLHGASPRAQAPFLQLNCAGLSESLLESELFGYERGAFADAATEKASLLEAASGGTLLLEHVHELPLATQIKLLRALEVGEVLRAGAREARPIDVRVIATTQVDLNEPITSGLFREDLFSLLNGISVLVPPLRERVDDIGPLARHYLTQACAAGGLSRALPDRTIERLEASYWPGNVRELRAVMERALVLCEGPSIEPEHLPPERPASEASARGMLRTNLRHEVRTLERERIERALADCQGNQRRAAALLGLSRGALLRRLEAFGIARPRKGS